MDQTSSSAFRVAFADALLVELRRQGVPRAAECADAIVQRVSVGGGEGNGAVRFADLAFGGAGLGDKGAIAVAEALLKLSSPAAANSHGVRCWRLLLNDNGLTDRSAAHLSLLVARCAPPLVLLDARDNEMTPAALQRIEEAHGLSSTPCVLQLPSTAANGETTSRCGSVSSASVSVAGRCGKSRRGVDVEALRRRRSALFASGGRPSGAASDAASSAAAADWLVQPPSRVSVGAAVESALRVPSAESAQYSPSPTCVAEEASHTHSTSPASPEPQTKAAPQQQLAGRGKKERQAEKEKEDSRREVVIEEDPLDVTANLSPLLRVVLDLSGMVPTGRLRATYGSDNIWDVVTSCGEPVSNAPHLDQTPSPARDIASAASFRSLTVLCLRQNGLESLQILPPSLLRLDVSDNALRDLTGVGHCRMLTLLNARRNRLRNMLGLEQNLALSHLFLGHNDIAFVEGIAHLLLLETLDLAHNRLKTQASIRPLSLSKGLRHLMLSGNPVVDRIKSSYRPLLRNLCPSLLSIDGDRLNFSRMAAKAQSEGNRIRLPYAPGDSISGVTVSASSIDNVEAVEVSQCASYMHLLTRGAAPATGSGYVDAQRAARTAKALQEQATAAGAADRNRKRQGRGTRRVGGEPLRQQLLKHLAEESRKYLESMLEERISSIQISQIEDTQPAGLKHSDLNDESGSFSNDTFARSKSKGREGGNPSVSGGRNRQVTEVTKDIVPVNLSDDDDEEDYQEEYSAISRGNQVSPLHRDTTLDHEQWLQLRGRRGLSSAPFGDTPLRTQQRPDTPDTPKTRCVENVIYISPIRKDEEACKAVSANATEILRDVDMLDPSFTADTKFAAKPKLNPRLVAASNVQRPLLLSPSCDSPPLKGNRIRSSSKFQKKTKPFTPLSPQWSDDIKAANERVLLSPPPPLKSPCSLHCMSKKNSFVKNWIIQLCRDTEAVQEAIETLVSLLDSRNGGNPAHYGGCAFVPAEVLAERRRCVEILTDSGMLLDIEVPLEVAQQYCLTPAELRQTNDEEYSEESVSPVDPRVLANSCEMCQEKRDILRCIRMIGDGKTCLRYLVLLIENGKERDLQHYVSELKVLIQCEEGV